MRSLSFAPQTGAPRPSPVSTGGPKATAFELSWGENGREWLTRARSHDGSSQRQSSPRTHCWEPRGDGNGTRARTNEVSTLLGQKADFFQPRIRELRTEPRVHVSQLCISAFWRIPSGRSAHQAYDQMTWGRVYPPKPPNSGPGWYQSGPEWSIYGGGRGGPHCTRICGSARQATDITPDTGRSAALLLPENPGHPSGRRC